MLRSSLWLEEEEEEEEEEEDIGVQAFNEV
jgi:hypothetical protein